MTLPNLERKDLKLFANDAAAQDNIAVFGSLASANPQFSKDIEAIQNLPAFLQGWAGAITGDASPALEDFNALFYVLFYQMSYLFQKGVAQWKATTDYYKGSFTTDGNGALYASIVDNNVGNDPATDDGTHWNKFPTPQEVGAKVSKSGDTMSGQLVMANGSNGVRFNGPTADNYYYVKGTSSLSLLNNENKGLILDGSTNAQPHYFDGTTGHRLLTTQDEINGNVVGYFSTSAPVAITLPYTAPANGWIRVFAQRTFQSGFNITLDGQDLFAKGSYGGQNDDTSSVIFPIKKGQVFNCNVALSNIYFFPNVL